MSSTAVWGLRFISKNTNYSCINSSKYNLKKLIQIQIYEIIITQIGTMHNCVNRKFTVLDGHGWTVRFWFYENTWFIFCSIWIFFNKNYSYQYFLLKFLLFLKQRFYNVQPYIQSNISRERKKTRKKVFCGHPVEIYINNLIETKFIWNIIVCNLNKTAKWKDLVPTFAFFLRVMLYHI